jgi:Outer membrane protein Omp28
MRSLINIFLSFMFPGIFFLGCTKIDAPYAAAKHGNIKDTVIDWDTVTITRKVMLEDYTGHKCVNCPEAAITAHSLEELYPGKLIIVSVHAGYYAIPGTGDYTLDLRCQASEEWNTDFKIVANPSGMINRKDFGSGVVIGPDKWGNDLAQVITIEPDAQMLIFSTYDTLTRTLNATVFSRFLEELPGSYTLTVCILEDGIIGAQKNNNPNIGPSPDWYGYIFNEVMRGALNSSKGEILTTQVNTSITYMGKFKFVLDPAWVQANCSLLAFISNSSTREIIQVEKKKIFP